MCDHYPTGRVYHSFYLQYMGVVYIRTGLVSFWQTLLIIANLYLRLGSVHCDVFQTSRLIVLYEIDFFLQLLWDTQNQGCAEVRWCP